MSTIAIIGAGSVGSTIASFLIRSGTCSEVLMVDIDAEKCEGQVMDLEDSSFVSDTRVRIGTFRDASRADIAVITAGAKFRKGETRADLLTRNIVILRHIVDAMRPISSRTIVVLVANPVDVLASLFQKISGLPSSRVIGTGTYLDSCRLRYALSERLGVAPSSVHAYVVGQHGDKQVALWSSTQVGGVNIKGMEGERALTKEEMQKMALAVRNKAYKIANAKGSTYYGIGACTTNICRNILGNRRIVTQLSVYNPVFKTYMSWPAIMGVVRVLPLWLTGPEASAVSRAAREIHSQVAGVLAMAHDMEKKKKSSVAATTTNQSIKDMPVSKL